MMMQDVQEAMAIIAADDLANFVNAMIADQSVIGVKAKDGADDRFVFGALGDAGQLRLDYDVTILPPKKYVLPPHEKLAEFKRGGGHHQRRVGVAHTQPVDAHPRHQAFVESDANERTLHGVGASARDELL